MKSTVLYVTVILNLVVVSLLPFLMSKYYKLQGQLMFCESEVLVYSKTAGALEAAQDYNQGMFRLFELKLIKEDESAKRVFSGEKKEGCELWYLPTYNFPEITRSGKQWFIEAYNSRMQTLLKKANDNKENSR